LVLVVNEPENQEFSLKNKYSNRFSSLVVACLNFFVVSGPHWLDYNQQLQKFQKSFGTCIFFKKFFCFSESIIAKTKFLDFLVVVDHSPANETRKLRKNLSKRPPDSKIYWNIIFSRKIPDLYQDQPLFVLNYRKKPNPNAF
jgi:hypothetical protein